MFSLAGIPPLAGFFAKLYVFLAAIEAELYPLAILGVLASVHKKLYQADVNVYASYCVADGRGSFGLPVVVMMAVRLVTRSGASDATCWPIMPPMEIPTTCAFSSPSRS